MIWLLIFFYGQSIFGLILIAQSMFSNARYAGIATSLVYFGLSLVNNSVNQYDSTRAHVMLVGSWSPAIPMIQSVKHIVHFEAAGVGLSVDNWHILVEHFDAKTGIGIIMCSSVYLLIIGLYLDQVIGTEFGKRKHPCFCFQKCRKKRRVIKVLEEEQQKQLQQKTISRIENFELSSNLEGDISDRHASFAIGRKGDQASAGPRSG